MIKKPRVYPAQPVTEPLAEMESWLRSLSFLRDEPCVFIQSQLAVSVTQATPGIDQFVISGYGSGTGRVLQWRLSVETGYSFTTNDIV